MNTRYYGVRCNISLAGEKYSTVSNISNKYPNFSIIIVLSHFGYFCIAMQIHE